MGDLTWTRGSGNCRICTATTCGWQTSATDIDCICWAFCVLDAKRIRNVLVRIYRTVTVRQHEFNCP